MDLIGMILAIGTFIYLFFLLCEFFFGFKSIKNLSDQASLPNEDLPGVSVILTALNEGKTIRQGLESLLCLDYPRLEVIAINDRSTDNTAEILEELKIKYSNLHVHHVDTLPDGWFGKNHGLHVAAQHAQGDWLLFTDSDVSMKPHTLQKAISYATQYQLDHLTVHEQHSRQGFWYKILLLGLYVAYNMVQKPWRIKFSWSKKSLGRAAFNLIKKQSYFKCGGHQPIALECLDDLKLGALIKKNGFRQGVANAHNLVEFRWYNSLQEMILGLEKNAFAFFGYRISVILLGFLLFFLIYIWPLLAILTYQGMMQLWDVLNIVLTLIIYAIVAKQYRISMAYAVFYPFAMTILLYTILHSVIFIYKNNGVIWRGTHYPLSRLKKQKI